MQISDEARCLAEALMERPEDERVLFLAHLNRWLEIMEGTPKLASVDPIIRKRNAALHRPVHEPGCRVPIGGSECSCRD